MRRQQNSRKTGKFMGYIRFENIVKNFGDTQVLKNISLDIEKGQLVTLLTRPAAAKAHFFDALPGWSA